MPLIFKNNKLLFRGGRLAMASACCCGPSCCDTPGGPPTPKFRYIQSGSGSSCCTISLFDQSVPGDCGSIVNYWWKKNGSQFSTAQNPTGVSVCDGDEIELTVGDSYGCQRAVARLIECGVPCGVCPDDMPNTVQVIIPTLTEIAPPYDCDACVQMGGTYTLTKVPGVCRWSIGDIFAGGPPSVGPCNSLFANPTYIGIELATNVSIEVSPGVFHNGHRLTFRWGTVGSIRFVTWYVATDVGDPCRVDFTMADNQTAGELSPNRTCSNAGTTAQLIWP